MRVSTRVEYGLIALMDIALYGENGSSVSTQDIARRQNISKKYLEQILPQLKSGGFIRAQKGVGGGYTLSCSPDEVTMADVLNTLDGSILEEMQSSERSEGELGPVINTCLWGRINHNLRKFAESISLAEFTSQCRTRISDEWDMYVI